MRRANCFILKQFTSTEGLEFAVNHPPATLFDQFLKERLYLKNVTPRTLVWYRVAFNSYLAQLASAGAQGAPSPFNVTLEVNLSFKRSTAAGALAVAITNDPSAPHLTLTEDDFKKIYKWTFQQLLEQLKKRYTDFKVNDKFNRIKKPLRDGWTGETELGAQDQLP